MGVEGFHLRLAQACEDSGVVPEKGKGRQVWMAQKLKISQEAARKYFAGEARPRPAKMAKLAAMLNVDEAWLTLGVSPGPSKLEKRQWSELADGAVYVAFGMLTMAGGHCAFPSDEDPRSAYADLYAIIRGQQLSLAVRAAREVTPHTYQVVLPREYRNVLCLGVVQRAPFRTEIVKFPHEDLDKMAVRRGGVYELSFGRNNSEYLTGRTSWPRVTQLSDFV